MTKIGISGTPGTGKSEIARALGEEIGWKVIELNKLAKEKGCVCGFDEKRKCEEVDVEKLAKEIGKMEGDFIIESHFAHCMPCDVVFILRTDPKELRKRLEKKGWKEGKIKENVEAEIMEVCKSEALEMGKEIYEIDTTHRKPREIVEEILKVINPYL